MRLPLLSVVAMLACGCAPLTPPPMILGHGSPRPEAAGTATLRGAGTVGAGFLVKELAAGGGRLAVHVRDDVAIGGQYDMGHVTHDGQAGRVFVHAQTGESTSAPRLSLGLGGGANDGGRFSYGTADIGLAWGTRDAVARVYGGPTLAVATPLHVAPDLDDRYSEDPSTTFYWANTGGLEVSLGEHVLWSLEVLLGGAVSGEGPTFIYGAGSSLGLRFPGS